MLSPGIVASKAASFKVTTGEPNGANSKRLEGLARTLAGSGIGIELSDHIEVDLWDKFVAACYSLGLSALTRATLAQIHAHAESETLALELMREVVAVGRARGIELPEGTPARWLAYSRARAAVNPELAGSMHFDVLQGRRLELEAMNGAVVRLGRELGVPTPLNFAVYAGLLPFANGKPS